MRAQIELSEKACVLCQEKENTVKATVKDLDFAGVLCPQHLFSLLKKNGNGKAADNSAGKRTATAQS